MKGVGMFRRALAGVGAAVGLFGLSGRLSATETAPSLSLDRLTPEELRRRPRKQRSRGGSGKYTVPRKNWPLLFWGKSRLPLTRKKLKQLAPEHYLLGKGRYE